MARKVPMPRISAAGVPRFSDCLAGTLSALEWDNSICKPMLKTTTNCASDVSEYPNGLRVEIN